MTTGRVRVWHADAGWGVLDSDETPGGCWVHRSTFHADAMRGRDPGAYSIRGGFDHLIDGETVDFDWEHVTDQDGYTYRATDVRPRRPTPPWDIRPEESRGHSTAFFVDLDAIAGGTPAGLVSIDSPDWVVAIAESLHSYLHEAAAMPPPTQTEPMQYRRTGWFTTPPGSPPVGRTPWIHMTDISITCSGDSITIGFRWKLDEPATAPMYLVPIIPMRAEPVLAADAVITQLDITLDTDGWQDRTLPAGPNTALLPLPPRHGR